MDYVIGMDTGGTFTDVIVLDAEGTVTAAKAPTTPHDLTEGIVDGIEQAAAKLGIGLRDLLAATTTLRFSGTTATNALLTRTGDLTGMITTAGFEDTLQIARARSAWSGLSETELRRVHRQQALEPLIPRALIRGVDERTDSDGSEVVPLDRDGVLSAARELVDAGVKAIAVCFLWSIRDASHEQEARRAIEQSIPDIPVHCSHDIAPAVGEYERFATTAVDAYVSPALTRFLLGFRRRLAENGFAGALLIAQADGGALFAEDARPVFTLHSGPAGGVIASQSEGQAIGCQNIVTTDVGGTSFDVGLIADGAWVYAREPELAGHDLSVDMIEVASIGAGGGSIAWVDELGVLHVGPRSAGSSPGPACYGRGGTQPTLTDADLILGYLHPDSFLDGRMKLDRAAAEAAIGSLADAMGSDILTVAAGIFEIANAHMADLLTRQVVSRGYDPREFVIFSYGGAGPMHGAFYAADAGAQTVIVPARAGTFSALGVTAAPIRHSERLHTFAQMPVAAAELNSALASLQEKVIADFEKDGIAPESREIGFGLDMRYGMQIHTVRLQIESRSYEDAEIDGLSRLFDQAYERLYGSGSGFPAAGRLLTGYAVDGYGKLAAPSPRSDEVAARGDAAPTTRPAHFGGGLVETDVFRYRDLSVGARIEGPAVIEVPESTIVIPPGCRGEVDLHGNVRITGLHALRSGGEATSMSTIGLEE